MAEDSTKEVAIPDPFGQLRRRLEEWRSAHPPRSRLPGEIWSAAAGLARQHGLYRTARTLQLDYVRLKEKVRGCEGKTADPPAAFLELISTATGAAVDCAIEIEGARGRKLRIQTRMAPSEVSHLIRAWRDGDA